MCENRQKRRYTYYLLQNARTELNRFLSKYGALLSYMFGFVVNYRNESQM